MGELRGGYIPGDLPPEERKRAAMALFEHVMGSDTPKDEPVGEEADESADDEKADK